MERDNLKFFRNKVFALNESGQTMVEYLLLLVVMATIISSIMITMKNKYLGDISDPKKCESGPQSKTMLCKINHILQPIPGNKKFEYFPFKK